MGEHWWESNGLTDHSSTPLFSVFSPQWFLLRGLILFLSRPLYPLTQIGFLEDVLLAFCFVVIVVVFFILWPEEKSMTNPVPRPADWLISWIIISRSATTVTAPLTLFVSVSTNFIQMFSDSPARYFVFCLSDVGVKNNDCCQPCSPESGRTHLGETIDFFLQPSWGWCLWCFFLFIFLWKTFLAKVFEASQLQAQARAQEQ